MGAPRPESPPRPRRDPRAETQQGPYATAPPRGLERGRAPGGRPAGQRYLRDGRGARHRRPPRPGRAAGRTVGPGVLRRGRSLPAALRGRGQRVSRGGAGAEGGGGRRARPGSGAAGQGGSGERRASWAAGEGQARPGGGRWQEGGDWSRGAAARAPVLLLLGARFGPFKPEAAGRKCVTRGSPDAPPAGPADHPRRVPPGQPGRASWPPLRRRGAWSPPGLTRPWVPSPGPTRAAPLA